MGIGTVVLFVVDGTQIQVGLQLTVGTFNFTDKIIIVPGGLFVKALHVGPQEIDAAVSLFTCGILNVLPTASAVPNNFSATLLVMTACVFVL